MTQQVHVIVTSLYDTNSPWTQSYVTRSGKGDFHANVKFSPHAHIANLCLCVYLSALEWRRFAAPSAGRVPSKLWASPPLVIEIPRTISQNNTCVMVLKAYSAGTEVSTNVQFSQTYAKSVPLSNGMRNAILNFCTKISLIPERVTYMYQCSPQG